MKTRHVLSAFFALGTLAALPATAARDPFWPIGYEPPKPEPVVAPVTDLAPAAKPPEPPKPVKPAERPITDADWAAARKALVISGFTQAVRPDTQEKRILAMVNRRMVAAGDTVTFIQQGIRFRWHVETITDRTLELVPLKAERVVQLPADLDPNK